MRATLTLLVVGCGAPTVAAFFFGSGPAAAPLCTTVSRQGARQGLTLCQLSSAPNAVTAVSTPAGNSSVKLSITVPGAGTQKAYDETISELSTKATIPGFGAGKRRRIPAQIILSHFGAATVKGAVLEELTESAIKSAIERVAINPIGQAKLLDSAESLVEALIPGEPLTIEVQVDVWPQVQFKGDYKGFKVTVNKAEFDNDKYDKTMASLQERAVELEDTAEGYAAQKQDSVFCNMLPYEELADGSRGSALPQMASGDDVEVVLSDERYMPGLVEGLVGVQAGQTREIRVQFPDNLRGPATALSGKRAIFDVEVSSVKKRIMPGMDDAFANKIRPGLTFDELKDEVLLAMNDEGSKKEAEARNKELDKALLEIIEAEIPETLLIEQTRQKFAVMMTEMRDQGQDDEMLKKMITPENFEKYKEVSRNSTTNTLKLSMAYGTIAEKEGLQVDPLDVDDQMELIKAETKADPDFDEAGTRDRVEASLIRELVLNWIAENSTVEVV